MKILFIVPSYKPAFIYGGPTVVIALLAEQLALLGHEVTVYTTTANGKNELPVPIGVPTQVDGVTVWYFKRITKDHTHVSPTLWKTLNKHVRQFDVVHIHSWWNILVMVAAWICKRNKVKPILSPHGMLSRYIFNTNNFFLKKVLHKLFGLQLLKHTWLHVSTSLEWQESQHVLKNWEGAIISNMVDLPKNEYVRNSNEIFTIGFLSRIDPKKGLDRLIQALAQVAFPFKLVIAGDGDAEYVDSLKKLAISLQIDSSIEWVGWQTGEEKFKFLSSIDLFALTSHSENFAIVVIEALAVGTPVFISDQVGLCEYVKAKDLGWVATLDIHEITKKLNKISSDTINRNRIHLTSGGMIKRDFDYSYIANQYIDLYTMNNRVKNK